MSVLGRVRIVAITAALIALASASAEGQQPLSPYTEFSSLTASQLAGAQVRFTFVGEHSGRGLPTLAFTTTGTSLDLSGFVPYHRGGLPYEGDSSAGLDFTVSPTELKAMIDSVATLPGVTDGGADSLGYVSFGLFCLVDGQPRCFESIVDVANGTYLFTKALRALAANTGAVEYISRHACMLGMLQSPKAIIVDNRVQITLRGFRRLRGTDQFVGRVRLKNTSTEQLAVPLAVALEPPMEMKVLDPAGFTCHIQPGGIPFVRFPATSPLSPGQSTEVVVRLLNPGRKRVEMNFIRAFVDSGGR